STFFPAIKALDSRIYPWSVVSNRRRRTVAFTRWTPGGRSAIAPLFRGLEALPVHGDHLVHDAVGPGLLCAHEVVAVAVLLDPLQGLPGVLGDDLVEPALHPEDLLGLDLDVGGLTLRAAHRLVNHDP